MVKILVCEDDRALNKLVCGYLSEQGYDITSCQNGEEGLDALEKSTYDLIITDIMMPKLDGFELAESVRITDKTTPIVFMSVKDDKPSKIADAVKIASKTMRIVWENIIFALGVKAVILILGALGIANMWLAVFGDVGVLIIAILNAMRCMRRLKV